MRLALFDPEFGYYRRPKARVGRAPGTDFFTSSNSVLFGELILSACGTLLSPRSLGDFTLVEIGAEPESNVLAGIDSPFKAVRTLRIGEALEIEGDCVVFSNELFDAQPFHRLVFEQGTWSELGVALSPTGEFTECVLPDFSPTVSGRRALLPTTAEEGYHLDMPIAATDLAAKIASQPWKGLFLAFDYGKSWRELTEETPAGTVRAYSQHHQSNDLLAQPGEQDLTGHICWDWLAIALATYGFSHPTVHPQESFFVRQAGTRIAEIMSEEAARLSPRKQSLMQLLHPSLMGLKFQALWAKRF